MNFKKHIKKYGRLYKLEFILLIPIIIIGILTFFANYIEFDRLKYIYIAFFFFASWFFTVIPIELILTNISEERKIKFRKRFKKKPKVFEYAFFLGLFWATALMTEAYSRNIETGLDLFKFFNTFGFATFCYGFASACGWYHYIERLDDE